MEEDDEGSNIKEHEEEKDESRMKRRVKTKRR